jgi:hypothetical protein
MWRGGQPKQKRTTKTTSNNITKTTLKQHLKQQPHRVRHITLWRGGQPKQHHQKTTKTTSPKQQQLYRVHDACHITLWRLTQRVPQIHSEGVAVGKVTQVGDEAGTEGLLACCFRVVLWLFLVVLWLFYCCFCYGGLLVVVGGLLFVWMLVVVLIGLLFVVLLDVCCG